MPSNMSGNKFGDLLRRYMEEQGRTQVDVAKGIGVSQGMVSAWVRGIYFPRFGTVQRLAEYLGVPVAALTGDMDEQQTDRLSAEFAETLKDLSDDDKAFLLEAAKRLKRNQEGPPDLE